MYHCFTPTLAKPIPALKRIAFGLTLIFLTTLLGYLMSIFDAGKSCVFSEVKATVTYKGKPAKGAKVSRLVEWKKRSTDETVTDDSGRFSLPAIFQKSATKCMPVEFVVAQVITVEYAGELYEIWVNTKRKAEENSELGGKPIELICELTEESKIYRDFDSLLETNCTWKK